MGTVKSGCRVMMSAIGRSRLFSNRKSRLVRMRVSREPRVTVVRDFLIDIMNPCWIWPAARRRRRSRWRTRACSAKASGLLLSFTKRILFGTTARLLRDDLDMAGRA